MRYICGGVLPGVVLPEPVPVVLPVPVFVLVPVPVVEPVEPVPELVVLPFVGDVLYGGVVVPAAGPAEPVPALVLEVAFGLSLVAAPGEVVDAPGVLVLMLPVEPVDPLEPVVPVDPDGPTVDCPLALPVCPVPVPLPIPVEVEV